MSDVDAAGAAVTAGLVAGVLEKSGRKRKGGEPHGPCANCGAEVTGNFCSICGQPTHVHRSLFHMAEEFLHGIFHFDTRAWRTLPQLVFRPGTLTNNYIRGRRARYVSPLAMFLLAVFAMFFVFELLEGGGPSLGSINTGGPPDPVASLEGRIEGVKGNLEGLQASREFAPPDKQVKIDEKIVEAQARQKDLEERLAQLKAAPPAPAAPAATPDNDTSNDSIVDEIRKEANANNLNVVTGWPKLDEKLNASLKNPDLAAYKVQNAFLLAPISLPFVWLLFFWKRRVSLFDHTVFILYSLSFVSLLFITALVTSMIPGLTGWVWSILPLTIPIHAYFQLKGGYQLGWFSALWRVFFLLIFEFVCLVIFLVVILILGLMN
jgi:hypothetical protein